MRILQKLLGSRRLNLGQALCIIMKREKDSKTSNWRTHIQPSRRSRNLEVNGGYDIVISCPPSLFSDGDFQNLSCFASVAIDMSTFTSTEETACTRFKQSIGPNAGEHSPVNRHCPAKVSSGCPAIINPATEKK